MARFPKERVEEILRENSYLEAPTRRYFEAIVQGNLVDYYLEEFRWRHEDRLNDLPEEDVREKIDMVGANVGSILYKCQTHHVVGLTTMLQRAIADEIIAGPIRQEVEEFLARDEALMFQVGAPENSAKLAEMNRVVEGVIHDLRTQIKKHPSNR
ncbi:MAG: hypothetical protein ACD_28C00390G0002 [uncultured bacterium]|nr:MAG: hypothetical protein ACD_28C00390G0002 [uncultured bacterium]KKT76873.1 MAG: hypothetical protein UW70_C0010G0015 [Candidatus Peregrinibacteria bacterium GW2011_GWA2_44_7]